MDDKCSNNPLTGHYKDSDHDYDLQWATVDKKHKGDTGDTSNVTLEKRI